MQTAIMCKNKYSIKLSSDNMLALSLSPLHLFEAVGRTFCDTDP